MITRCMRAEPTPQFQEMMALTDTYKYDYHLVGEMRRSLTGLIIPKWCIGFTFSDVKYTVCILTNLFGNLLCHLQLKAKFY